MSKLIKGTHHTAIKCADYAEFEKVIGFYTDVLEMEVIRSWGEGDDAGAMLNTGSSILEFFASGKVSSETGSVNHFALETDDVDACAETAVKAGCTLLVPPADIDIPSDPVFPIRMCFVRGLAGEEIEFFCVK